MPESLGQGISAVYRQELRKQSVTIATSPPSLSYANPAAVRFINCIDARGGDYDIISLGITWI